MTRIGFSVSNRDTIDANRATINQQDHKILSHVDDFRFFGESSTSIFHTVLFGDLNTESAFEGDNVLVVLFLIHGQLFLQLLSLLLGPEV